MRNKLLNHTEHAKTQLSELVNSGIIGPSERSSLQHNRYNQNRPGERSNRLAIYVGDIKSRAEKTLGDNRVKPAVIAEMHTQIL